MEMVLVFLVIPLLQTSTVQHSNGKEGTWQGSSTSLPAVTKLDGLPPAPSWKHRFLLSFSTGAGGKPSTCSPPGTS
eukprot:9329672-Pyramimonas_sp.AAC.1